MKHKRIIERSYLIDKFEDEYLDLCTTDYGDLIKLRDIQTEEQRKKLLENKECIKIYDKNPQSLKVLIEEKDYKIHDYEKLGVNYIFIANIY